MAFTSDDIPRLSGATVVDPQDEQVGTIGQVYVDPDGHPSWATIRTGVLSPHEPFFPLEQAVLTGSDLHVPFTMESILNAPQVESDEELSVQRSVELHEYYDRRSDVAPPAGGVPSASDDASDPTTDVSMTRSEERLQVGVRLVERGRVRLRKHIVTERRTVTVPVRREQAALIREAVTEEDLASVPADRALSEEVHEIVLYGDVIVTDRHVVPVERIRLGTERVTEQQEFTGEVRKEQIDLIDQDGATR